MCPGTLSKATGFPLPLSLSPSLPLYLSSSLSLSLSITLFFFLSLSLFLSYVDTLFWIFFCEQFVSLSISPPCLVPFLPAYLPGASPFCRRPSGSPSRSPPREQRSAEAVPRPGCSPLGKWLSPVGPLPWRNHAVGNPGGQETG